MSSLNKVILIGNLCADPELKQTQTGVSVCSFSIGISRRFKNADGKYESDFINIVTWRQTAEFVCKYFKKGKSICVVGSLQQRSWTDQQQQKRYTVEVHADEVSFIGKNDNGDQAEAQTEPAANTAPSYNNAPPAANFEDLAENDDLPF